MEPTIQPGFSLAACYGRAWKSFAKWWIPLCLVAACLILFELGPKQLAKAQASDMYQSFFQLLNAFVEEDLGRTEQLIVELNDKALAYTKTVATFSLYAMPVVAVLSILLLCASVMAVKDQRIRYSPWHILWVSMLNMIVAFVKIFLLFIFLPLGIYMYVKLYFTSLAMIEERRGLAEAIKRSWRLTDGSFWPLLGIVAINGTLQMAMVPTLIGLVPASGFANTARATAFELLRVGEAAAQ